MGMGQWQVKEDKSKVSPSLARQVRRAAAAGRERQVEEVVNFAEEEL